VIKRVMGLMVSGGLINGNPHVVFSSPI